MVLNSKNKPSTKHEKDEYDKNRGLFEKNP
jgi:hypothetical protein